MERSSESAWEVPPRLPLGDAYSGECRAADQPFVPDAETRRRFCNCGYGRGHCERFPLSARVDAVRFHVGHDGGEIVRLQYVFERSCWPIEHGLMEYSSRLKSFSAPAANDLLIRQAEAFLESYARRKQA